MLVNEEFGRILTNGRLDELAACRECYTCLESILNRKPVGRSDSGESGPFLRPGFGNPLK